MIDQQTKIQTANTLINGRPAYNKRAASKRAVSVALLLLFMCLTWQIQPVRAQWQSNGTNVYYNGGNVGIGTSSPGDRLGINGNIINGGGITIDTPGNSKYRIGTLGSTIPDWGGQFINAKYNEGAENWTLDDTGLNAGFFKLDARNNHPTSGKEIAFYRMPAGPNPRADSLWTAIAQFKLDTGNILFATTSGSVGIGITTPSAAKKLHVVGDVQIDGNIAAKYQDVAEWVVSSQRLPAGTVVILNPHEIDQVLASSTAYDTSVAGVVSDRPGLLLGEAGANKVKVATTGRVKVKVDAGKMGIKIGDLLVTSNRPGVAMKSTPLNLGGASLHRPGTLIGKALEPLKGGATGEILVLLSLQ